MLQSALVFEIKIKIISRETTNNDIEKRIKITEYSFGNEFNHSLYECYCALFFIGN